MGQFSTANAFRSAGADNSLQQQPPILQQQQTGANLDRNAFDVF
jgi:hypothetical protein